MQKKKGRGEKEESREGEPTTLGGNHSTEHGQARVRARRGHSPVKGGHPPEKNPKEKETGWGEESSQAKFWEEEERNHPQRGLIARREDL